MTMSRSNRVEVQADSTRAWSSNMLRFATEHEAEDYGHDLWSHWDAMRAWRVVEADDEATHRWNFSQGCPEPLPCEPPALRIIDGGKVMGGPRWRHRWGER